MTARARLVAAVLAAVSLLPVVVEAQTFRLVAPDGTVHYTNAPTDPTYERLGIAPRRAVRPAVLVRPVDDGSMLRLIRDAAERHGVPERLVLAVIRAESGFDAGAVSRKGARGLMQLMPQTASLLGVQNSFDPAENIDGGVRHLRSLIDRFNADLRLALAAYNAGENAVTLYRGIPPYPETQGYVQRVLRYFNGDLPADAAAAPRLRIYQLTQPDGTVVYTNIPPVRSVSVRR